MVRVLSQTKLGPVFSPASGQADGALGPYPSFFFGGSVAASVSDPRGGLFGACEVLEPLWGASLRTQASILSSEFVLMFPWNAERNYLTADQQGHYQFGRYQEALGRNDTVGNMARMGAYMEETTALDQLAAGLRVQGQIDEITLGVSGVWGPDQTPVLLGAPADYQYFMTSLDSAFVSDGCGADGCPLASTDPLFTRESGLDHPRRHLGIWVGHY